MSTPVPVADASATRLVAVARWDVSLVHSAVAVLAAVAARLPVRRLRLAEIGRSLQEPDCWTGPAARAAVAAVLEISAVAASVDEAVRESLEHLQRLAREADTAQELATAALRSGSSSGWDGALASHARLAGTMDLLAPGAAGPQPEPATALVLAALEHSALALAAATAAAEPVVRLGNLGSGGGATFGELAARIILPGPAAVPVVPVRSSPPEVAAWWAGLSLAAQLASVRRAPAGIGSLDGLPAWARDRANRLVLARALRDPAIPPLARAVAREVDRRVAAEEIRGRRVQLHLLDLAGDRVVLALGDLDTAAAVALLVPGVGNSPGDDLGELVRDAADVEAAARAVAPDLAVATVVWLGYRPPRFAAIVARTAARTGGTALAADLGGLSAARAVAGRPPPRTTVLAHSYGTVVVDEAADEPGRLLADAVVLLGSPGMEDDARSLEVADVFDAGSPADPVAALGYFGQPPTAVGYGSTALPLDPWTGHSDYYDSSRPTLGAIGEVVAGVRRSN